jgi:hypothetical protein
MGGTLKETNFAVTDELMELSIKLCFNSRSSFGK